MKKIILAIVISAITMLFVATQANAQLSIFKSNQVGSSPSNGYILSTDGVNSTWIANTGGGGGGGTDTLFNWNQSTNIISTDGSSTTATTSFSTNGITANTATITNATSTTGWFSSILRALNTNFTAGTSTNWFATTLNATTGFITSLIGTNATITNATSTNTFATNAKATNLTIDALTGLLKGTSGLVSTASNGTDYTLIGSTTCSGTDKVSKITADGIITCSADQTGGGSGTDVNWTYSPTLSAIYNSTTTNEVGVGTSTNLSKLFVLGEGGKPSLIVASTSGNYFLNIGHLSNYGDYEDLTISTIPETATSPSVTQRTGDAYFMSNTLTIASNGDIGEGATYYAGNNILDGNEWYGAEAQIFAGGMSIATASAYSIVEASDTEIRGGSITQSNPGSSTYGARMYTFGGRWNGSVFSGGDFIGQGGSSNSGLGGNVDLFAGTGPTNGAITFNQGSLGSASEIARFDESGDFGIGSSTPSRKLTVAGDAVFANTWATGTASSTYASTSALTIYQAFNLPYLADGCLRTTSGVVSSASCSSGGGSISTSSIPVAGNLTYWTSPSTVSDVATGTLTETVTGLELSATRGLVGGSAILSLTNGYTVPTTSSTTEWGTFYQTPSTRITAGNHIDWTSNTLDVVTTGDWTGTLDGFEGATLAQTNWLFNGTRLSPSSTVGIGVFSSSTLTELNFTNATGTNATTTNLFATNASTSVFRGAGLSDCDGASNALIWDVTTGKFSCNSIVGGSGEQSDWQLGGTGYIIPTTTVGIVVSASSTIGNGTATGGLTVSGNSTTTGTALFSTKAQALSEFELIPSAGGSVGDNGSAQFTRGVDDARLDLFGGTNVASVFRSSSVSSEMLAQDGTDYVSFLADSGASGIEVSDSGNRITFQSASDSYINTPYNFGIGSSTPSRKLTVGGDAIFANTWATGTASSTYASTSALTLYQRLYDTNSSAGSSGQVLTSTGTSTIWATPAATGGGSSNWILNAGADALTPSSTKGIVINASSSILSLTTQSATTTNLTVNSERFTDLTGFGLANSANALGIDQTGAANGECLKYNSTGPAINWDSCGGAATAGGDDEEIQFNDGTALNGADLFTFDNETGRLGLGTTSPSAFFAIASSTYDYSIPLFEVATSTNISGDVLKIFATTSIAGNQTGTSIVNGARLLIGAQPSFLDNANISATHYVNGIHESSYMYFKCDASIRNVAPSGETIGHSCQDAMYWEDGTGASITSTLTVGPVTMTSLSFQDPTAGGGAGLSFSGGNVNETLGSSTPKLEGLIGVNSGASTTVYFGFTNTQMSGTSFDVAPTVFVGFTASATHPNWTATVKTSASASTSQNTGIPSTTPVFLTVQTDSENAYLYIATATQKRSLALPPTSIVSIRNTQITPAAYFGRVLGGSSSNQFTLVYMEYWKRKPYMWFNY